ncbi:SLAC1 anion channel family protein [Vibrio salinus]|uniref:SLAC1 anion channel family protein n=1 Tax=Vibrio salinus TaxID=2899784 RepID=UPI001E6278BB|nr:SLAC1 anion channel family protein [Vibrio salinus]MCE0495729.1 SLAC1 anion channel family protein [Vibrio salinus]
MNDTTLLTQNSRLSNFPISFYAIVMGLTGLAISYRAADFNEISRIITMLSSFIFLLVTGFYATKVLLYRAKVLEEIKHPVRINFFPAFSISLLLLSIAWQHIPLISGILWHVGAIVHISLTLFVMSSWIHHTHYRLEHANPSWFIPVVGNIIVPINGVSLGYIEISWFFFSIGIVFWLILLTIILYRLFFHESLPARLTPMLFILLAPPSVGFVSYTILTGGIDTFSRIIYYVGLFLAILLMSNLIRFTRIPFFISSWAYSFPCAALTIATFKFSHLTHSGGMATFGNILLLLISLLFIWLIMKTIKAIIRGLICQPE